MTSAVAAVTSVTTTDEPTYLRNVGLIVCYLSSTASLSRYRRCSMEYPPL